VKIYHTFSPDSHNERILEIG